MGSATEATAQKRLGEFLKEQQEPFILDDYLLERGCFKFKTWTMHRSNKNIKSVLPFSRVLTSLYSKFALHNQGSRKTNQPDDEDEADDRFSSASSSTLFNSCSDVDEHQTCISNSSDISQVSSDIGVQSQQAGKHGWKCIGRPISLRKILSRTTPLSQNEVAVNEKRMRSCRVQPKTVLSGELWGLFIIDGGRTLPTREQGYKQFLGPQLLPKINFRRTKPWAQLATCETNLTYSFTVNSICDFHPHVEQISFEIADDILECLTNEIVSENIQYLPVM